MKLRGLYFLLICSLFLGACKTLPRDDTNKKEPDLAAAVEDEAEAAVSADTDVQNEPEETGDDDRLIEPVLDLAETDTVVLPEESDENDSQKNDELSSELPEPQPGPELSRESEPEDSGVLAAPLPANDEGIVPVQPPSLPVLPPASPEKLPPPAPKIPPVPPRNPKPAEEIPPAIIREPAPPVPLLEAIDTQGEPEITPIPPAPDPADENIVFSRVVRATVGQLIEIPFRGTGWVYLGELGSRRGIVYDSRRLDPEGQNFVFRAEAAGSYVLKFYKQDFIRDYILNDHVQVLIGEAPETAGAGWFNPPVDRGRVTAEPRWPETGNPGTSLPRSSVPDEGIVPVPPPALVVPPQAGSAASSEVNTPQAAASPVTPPGEYLQKAREEFEAGRVAGAITLLDTFRELFPSGSDEAWWLYGQFYEAVSPSRDIRLSLDYYRRLIREYPQSSRYNDARRRIAYLERFYINIQ
jgi:hypothetical protein